MNEVVIFNKLNHKKSGIKISQIRLNANYNLSLEKNLFNDRLGWKKIIIKFLFPLFPLKITNTIFLITFLAVLTGIRLILSIINLPILPLGFTISFAWLPIYICGFFYGPVIGFVFGFLMDTLINLTSGGIWFWLYAIQEPVVGLVSGIVGSIFLLNKITKLITLFVIEKIFVYGFSLFSIFFIVYQFYLVDQKFSKGGLTNIEIFTILAIVLMIIYLIINEIQSYVLFKKSKRINRYDIFCIYLYVSFLVLFMTILFSFILGPISFVKYTEFINGHPPNAFLNYGSLYYLLPRVLKESIKTPIYIILLVGIVIAIKQPFINIIQLNLKRWGN